MSTDAIKPPSIVMLCSVEMQAPLENPSFVCHGANWEEFPVITSLTESYASRTSQGSFRSKDS